MVKRMDRIDQLLQQEISRLVQDDAESLGIVSIIGVQTTRDFSQAHIRVQSLSPDSRNVLAVLERQATSYRGLLGRRLALYRVPQLFFQMETESPAAQRVASLLDEIAQERQ